MKKVWLFIPLFILIGLLLVFSKGVMKEPKSLPSVLIGQAMPPFTLTQLDNANIVRTEKDFSGQVALVNVWATWCIGCEHEHPVLIDIAALDQVPIYGINYRDDQTAALLWLEKFGDPYVFTAFDPQAKMAIDWGVYGAPETFVIDAQGIIRYRHVGPITFSVWREVLLPLVLNLQREVYDAN